MRKEFVVMQISAMRDGSPNVVLTLFEEKLIRPREEDACDLPYPRNYRPFDQDYMTAMVVDMNEYAGLGLKVGDRVTVELTKSRGRKLEFGRAVEEPRRGAVGDRA